MRADPLYRKITAEQFLAMDFGTDRKFELVDGVIYMMTGGTEPHAFVQLNIASWLKQALRGSGCRPYGSEMGVRVGDTDVRYPDVSVYCGPRPEDRGTTVLTTPKVIIEVLSRSTTTYDQGTKLDEYQRLPSVELIALIDPINELVRTVERTGSESWLDTMFSARDLTITPLGLTIPHADIFADD